MRNINTPLRALLAMTIAILALVACGAPAQPTPVPTPPPQIVTVVATPNLKPTFLVPTATPTIAATPTPFVTPPRNGEAAIVPILMYHHISDLPSNATELQQTWTVAPAHFDAQINWLSQRGFHTITMAQLVAHLKNREPLPSKPIIISFDDGWAEQYVVAFPTLRKHGFIATFFVYTSPLDHKQFMTWAQVQEMSAAGMDFQAHTLRHPHLRTMSADAAYKEIAESKSILEKRLGKSVIAFAYPFGEYNAVVIELVRRAGFESAVTLAAGYKQRADELLTLHRIRVSYDDTLDDFAKRLPP